MKITNFKEYAKKAKRTILAKTALLVGLTVPLASCGKPVDKETNKLSETKKIVAIEDTNSTEILEGATIEEVEVTTNEKGDSVKITEAKTEDGETIKITETTNEKGETVKVTEQTNEKGETVKITEKTNEKGETVKITEKKDENGEVIEHIETATVEKTTGGKTNTVTTSKITNKTTTTKLKGKTTVQTTRVTTKPVVTVVKTQPVQTQPPVTQPIVTQPPVTEPPKPVKTSFNKYDLLDQDPDVAAQAFDKLAEQLWKELYNGKGCYREYGMSNGYGECQVALAILNYDQGINPQVFSYEETLGCYDYQTILEMSHTLDFGSIEHFISGTRVDFKKYMLDETKAEYINNTASAWIENEKGNDEKLYNLLENFYANMYKVDPMLDYYTAGLFESDNTNQNTIDIFLEEQGIYDNSVVTPLYNSYAPYIGRSYRIK